MKLKHASSHYYEMAVSFAAKMLAATDLAETK